MTTPEQEAKWLPIAKQITARWGVSHASLEATIATEIAGVVAEERERCAKIALAHDNRRYASQVFQGVEIANEIRAPL